MSALTINWNEKRSVFELSVPFWANDLLEKISTKSFSRARKIWVVPVSRLNVEALLELVPASEMSKATLAQLHYQAEHCTKHVAIPGFPANYLFKTQPLAIQKKALNASYGKNAAALHLDMGLGKSKIAIDLATAAKLEGRIDAVLVIVRKTLRLNWVGYDHGERLEGFIGHCPIPCDFHLPKGADKNAQGKFDKWLHKVSRETVLPVLIMSTEAFSSGSATDFINGAIGIVNKYVKSQGRIFTIMDEAADIANHKSNRSKKIHRIGAMSEFRVTCTGTPIVKSPLDLYSQFKFLDPNIIGISNFVAFRNRYAIMGGYVSPMTGQPMEVIGYKNLDELTKTVAPFIFEAQKKDVIDLPPKVFERRFIELLPEQKAIYKQIKKTGLMEKEGDVHVVQNTLELMLRLQQIVGGIQDICKIEPDKNPKLLEVIDICKHGKPTVIWCLYRSEIDAVVTALTKVFPKESIMQVHGGINEKIRSEVVTAFQSGKCRLIVGNTASGGTGLTLTACEIMVYYNNSQKMTDRLQSEDRAMRIGTKHSVLYIDLVASGTVDETVLNSIEAKMDLAEYVRLNIRNVKTLYGDL